MMKTLLSATALAMLVAGPVMAQATKSDAKVEVKSDGKVTQRTDQINADKLMGRNIVNGQGDKIGEIESVLIGKDGKTQAVIVGVGGFLGIGERKVALGWNDLQFMDNGERVVADMSKDQLKALPEFTYASREPVRTERTAMAPATTAPMTAAPVTTAQTRATTTPATKETKTMAETKTMGDTHSASLGRMRADEIIGKNVVNARGQTVGEVEDIVIDNNKAVMAILSVGGFLGMGDKDVAIPFDQLRVGDKNAILMSETSEDQLKQLPAYKKSDTWRSVDRTHPVLQK